MTSANISQEYLADVITQANQINAVKYFLTACVAMLFYDTMITLNDEIEYIWNPKKTVASYLYLLNRYLNPCFYIITMISFFDPSWTTYTCHKFARFEGAATCTSYAIIDALLILRVHALWQNVWLACGLGALGLCQVALWAYALANSGPVSFPPIPEVFRGCILAGRPDFGDRWQLWLFLYLAFDCTVCGLVLFKTACLCRMKHSLIARTLRRDGCAYFLVIFAANLSWLVMTFRAPAPMKNFNAHFSHLISVVLVSRLTLHLRSQRANQLRIPITSSGGGGAACKPPSVSGLPTVVSGSLSQHSWSHESTVEEPFSTIAQVKDGRIDELEMGSVHFTKVGRLSDVEYSGQSG